MLFSSGTTGDPKAIPWTHLTPIKCAMDGHFHQDIQPGDVVAWPTNIGWMMGPWLIYATLINRACIALYEGLPSGPGFADFVRRSGRDHARRRAVPGAGLARLGRLRRHRLVRLRVFSSTGEPSNRQDYLWLMSRTGYRAPVIEYCGGTEIGGGYVTGTVVQPASPATFTTPALGLDLVILDEAGRPGGRRRGRGVPRAAVHRSLPDAAQPRSRRGLLRRLPGGPGRRSPAPPRRPDGAAPGGYYRAQGRADDTMNLGGIKVSSLELERVLETPHGVFEAAAVAVQPGGEGAETLVVFAVLPSPADRERTAAGSSARWSRDELNPLFKIHDLVIVEALPRTASNKLMRRNSVPCTLPARK